MGEVSADSLMIAGPRKRGRPPVAEPLQPVTTWVPPAYLERLDRLARKHDVSVSKLVCRVLLEAMKKKPER